MSNLSQKYLTHRVITLFFISSVCNSREKRDFLNRKLYRGK